MDGPGSIGNKTTTGTTAPPPTDIGGGPEVSKTDTAQTQKTQQSGQPVDPKQAQQDAQQAKGAKQYAFAKNADMQLSAQARGLTPAPTKEQQLRAIVNSARTLGAEEAEITKLSDRLKGLNDQDFKKEYNFFNANIISIGGNADRAIRTYNELKSMQDQHPDRLANEHIYALTRGVGESRTSTPKGWEGVIGQEGAMNAAKALIDMPKTDYDAINRMLDKAGKGADGKQVSDSSPAMEKALILKAAAARNNDLANPDKFDRALNLSGAPSRSMVMIGQFADDIRGTKRDTLVQQSTAIDPYEGNKAIQQRWSTSCGPTTSQAFKAELDPIYARKLHQEFIHGTSTSGNIASEQKKELQDHGGVAKRRDEPGGVGTNLGDVMTTMCTRHTGVTYSSNSVGNTEASRKLAVDDAAAKLKRGIDVPIRVKWSDGSGHFMILTDVRGQGKDQIFLLTDPWKGQTVWINRDSLAADKAGFPAGIGTLTHTY